MQEWGPCRFGDLDRRLLPASRPTLVALPASVFPRGSWRWSSVLIGFRPLFLPGWPGCWSGRGCRSPCPASALDTDDDAVQPALDARLPGGSPAGGRSPRSPAAALGRPRRGADPFSLAIDVFNGQGVTVQVVMRLSDASTADDALGRSAGSFDWIDWMFFVVGVVRRSFGNSSTVLLQRDRGGIRSWRCRSRRRSSLLTLTGELGGTRRWSPWFSG